MADENGQKGSLSGNALSGAAARVLENLAELEPQLINAAIFDAQHEPVAVTADSPQWPSEAAGLLKQLEAASGPEEFDSAHIASAEGEVFAVTESGLSLVAVTGRFVLAALTSYDMRMALRDVARAESPGTVKGAAEAKSEDTDDA